MANAVDICNLALSHLGSDAVVTSISPPDGSVEAGRCAQFYPLARKVMLSSTNWSFATKRVALAEVANPSNVWLFAYAQPADCLKPINIFKLGAEEEDTADYEIEDGIILTNESGAVLKYIRDVTDTTKYISPFVSALSWMLASYLAGPTIKGAAGANAATSLLERAMVEARASGANDANRSDVKTDDFRPQSLRVR